MPTNVKTQNPKVCLLAIGFWFMKCWIHFRLNLGSALNRQQTSLTHFFPTAGTGAPGQISVIEMFTAASLKPKHRLSISFPESFIAFNSIPCALLSKSWLA